MRFGARHAFRTLSVASALFACNGIVGFGDLQKVTAEPTDGGEDVRKPGREGGAPTSDAGLRCSSEKPFETPELMEELDPQADTHSAVMTDNELEIFYVKGSEFRHGRRSDRNAAWTIVTEPLDPPPEDAISLSAGGLKIYYWILQQPLRATRDQLGEPFGVPQNFLTPSKNPIFVVSSDDEHYYIGRLDGGEGAVHRGTLSTNGAGTGSEVPGLHAEDGNDSFPVLNRSQTVLYFTSTRPDGLGSLDIYTARRTSRQALFGPPSAVRELSTAGPDVVTWVADDDCEVLLDRASHIYRARRPL